MTHERDAMAEQTLDDGRRPAGIEAFELIEAGNVSQGSRLSGLVMGLGHLTENQGEGEAVVVEKPGKRGLIGRKLVDGLPRLHEELLGHRLFFLGIHFPRFHGREKQLLASVVRQEKGSARIQAIELGDDLLSDDVFRRYGSASELGTRAVVGHLGLLAQAFHESGDPRQVSGASSLFFQSQSSADPRL
jgi:hypothetical protein